VTAYRDFLRLTRAWHTGNGWPSTRFQHERANRSVYWLCWCFNRSLLSGV